MSLARAGYDKLPKHASIACRQLADFVGRDTENKFLEEKKKRRDNLKNKNITDLYMPLKLFILFKEINQN